MIRIEHISFDFTAPDEGFAQALYADWDGFCRRCFERVAEECLAPYGDDRLLHEIERLDLDLGTIPEADFRDEYPRRLREALLDALPSLPTLQAQARPEKTAVSRKNNLLRYLEHGHPLPEWADGDFDCRRETEWLAGQASGFYREAVRELSLLCLRKGHPLRRLMAQAGDSRLLSDLYVAAIAEPSAGQAEKRRLLVLFLEAMPDIPVHFIRRVADDGGLRDMADLLDSLTVRQLIRTEAKEHAEVDLPPYWHYLYGWLIRYYPYNGIAMFGGKAEFTRHLHHRLLTFIRKRDGASYLSKAELTVGFLLEVFGPAYYRDVLDAIYRLQPHHPDGSPVFDGYFNMELYRTFLRLSLLRYPDGLKEKEARPGTDAAAGMGSPVDDAGFTALLASLSFAAWERVERVAGYVRRHKQETGWLKNVTDAALDAALRKSVRTWVGSRHHLLAEKESLYRLLLLLYEELGNPTDGSGKRDGKGSDKSMVEGEIADLASALQAETRGMPLPIDTQKAVPILKDPARSTEYKRLLLAIWAKEQPEELLRWLREAAKDETLLSILADCADETFLHHLFSAVPFAAGETVAAWRTYLQRQKEIPGLPGGLTEDHLGGLLRRATVRWLSQGNLTGADGMENLLRMVYLEATGSTDDAAVEELARKIRNEWTEPSPERYDTGKELSPAKLQAILSDPELSEGAKRRATARFWDDFRDDYAHAVRLLHAHGLLAEAVRLTGAAAWTAIARQIALLVFKVEEVSDMIPLLEWLAAHEADLSGHAVDNNPGIRGGLLLWLALRTRQDGTDTGNCTAHALLASLLRESGIRYVVEQLTKEAASDGSGLLSDAWQALALLEESVAPHTHILGQAYREWLSEEENLWQTTDDFAEWLADTSEPAADKRERLREVASRRPQDWFRLLRTLPEEARKIVPTLLTTNDLLESMAGVSFPQAEALSRIAERLLRYKDSHPLLPADSVAVERLLRKMLLMYLSDATTLNHALPEKDIAAKAVRYLYVAATGKEGNGAEIAELTGLLRTAEDINETDNDGLPMERLPHLLSDPAATAVTLRHTLVRAMDREPKTLTAWLAQEASAPEIVRLAEASDSIMVMQWARMLSATQGFAHADAFLHLTEWLARRMPAKELAEALFLFAKEPEWTTYTAEQMESFFFPRLSAKRSALLSPETLADESLSEGAKKRLFRQFIRLQPENLSAFIRKSVSTNTFSPDKWLEWTDASDWLELAASLSPVKAELLHGMAEILSLTETERKTAWAAALLRGDTQAWRYDIPRETVRDFVEALPAMQGKDAATQAETVRKIEAELGLSEEKATPVEAAPELMIVGNAGLCLLAPWFVRLFGMLGYLDEERRQFRNTASKVRAVFLLQYLVCGKEEEWRETELAFNRLLTAMPGNIPLPKQLALTDEERRTADGMVAGVKANWRQMDGTSVEGFRGSFLARGGTLEQEEERWLLTVEEKAYDILLDTIPWAFRQVRLPWLKKHVQVIWHEKQAL